MGQHRILRAAACALLSAGAMLAAAPAARAAEEAPDTRTQLDMLTHEVEGLRQQLWAGPRVNGYYAFEYTADSRAQSPATFNQQAFSLFIGRNWDRWRVLTEIEYEDGPDIEVARDAMGNPAVSGNGGVKMEYGWFEYRAADALVVRGGKFLLPQYWNVNHYAPVVLSTMRPLVVRNVFPTDTVGMMLHGKVFPGATGASYSVYYANGQSTTATDDNPNKAVGGHVTVHLGEAVPWFSRLDLGASVHSERAASLGGGFDVVGADAQVNTTRYELLFEYAHRAANPDVEGFYLQPSVRLFAEVRGFYRYDYLDDGANPETRHTVGVNWRPEPNVSLKLEGSTSDFARPGRESFEEVATSVALFF